MKCCKILIKPLFEYRIVNTYDNTSYIFSLDKRPVTSLIPIVMISTENYTIGSQNIWTVCPLSEYKI